MRQRHFFLPVFLCLALLLISCDWAKPNREDQCPLPFFATIEGTRGELAFAAEIRATAEEQTIRYTAPYSLAGLTVTRTSAGISVLQGDFDAKNRSDAAGFLAPLDLLLFPADLASVEEQNGEKTLTYTDGTKLILQRDGTPRAVIGSDLFFTISDFRRLS